MKKVLILHFLSFFFYIHTFCFNCLPEEIDNSNKTHKVNQNEVFVEADVVKGGKDVWSARGNVIVKKQEGLINADDVQVFRQKQIGSKKNNNTVDKKDKDRNDNKQKEVDEKTIINAKDNVKVRTNNDDFIFAKSMFYDERTSTGLFKNAHIFPYQKNGRSNFNLYTTQLEKKENIYMFKDAIISPCNIFDDSNIANMRTHCFVDMTEEDEIITTPKNNDTTTESNEELKNSLKGDFITIGTNQLTFDREQKFAKFDGITLRLLRVPVFYWPSYSVHTDGRGDTGFLMPSYMIRGTKQIGIELPFYWKIKDNMDFTISRMQYIDIYKWTKGDVNLNNKNEKLNLKDRFFMHESSTNLRFRHTIHENFGERSFYSIEGIFTDPTALFDNDADYDLAKVDDEGHVKKGIRWFFRINSKIKFSKTTFLQVDWQNESDRRMSYLYKFNFSLTKTNYVKLFDVRPNSYLFAGIYNYRPIMTKIDNRTIPIIYPVVRAEYDFKKDKFGGNFYIKTRSFYVNRTDGLSNLGAAIDGGYKLVHIFDIGTKLTFDTMERLQYNHIWNNNIGNPINPLIPLTYNNTQFFYGNYARLEGLNHYGANNLVQGISFNKLQAEHPIVMKSVFGTTIVNPKVAIKYVPHIGRNYFLIDDNIGAFYNYANAFELTQTSGLGMYDTGASAIYGASITQKFNSHVEWTGQLAHSTRFYKQNSSWYLTEPTGFVNSFSDLMAQSEIKFSYNGHIIKVASYANMETQHNTIRYLNAQITYTMPKKFTLSFVFNNYDKTATYFGQNVSMITMGLYWQVFRDLDIFGSITYNLKTLHTRTFDVGKKLTYYRVGFKYTIGCLQLGLTVYENLMVAPGIPSNRMYMFTFNITGIG